MIPPDLAAAVRTLMGRRRVLVGLDFDGVLAPIVDRRDDARPVPGAMAAVRRLARCAGIEVALVSGRALDSLRGVSGVSDEDDLSLVGSHGAEAWLRPSLRDPLASGLPGPSTPGDPELLTRVVAGLEEIAGGVSGLEVEVKPSGAVLHTRLAAPEAAQRATDAAVAGPGSWPGAHVTLGKSVVEIAVTETSKGAVLQQLRAATRADGAFYAGDDVTDESAFEVLTAGDVTVKVGPGDTRAAYRLDGPNDVLELVQLLVAERSQR